MASIFFKELHIVSEFTCKSCSVITQLYHVNNYLILNLQCAFMLDTEIIYTRVTQEILEPYGKTFDWSIKSKMMGRGSLEAAKVLVEELQLPLTAEECVKISQDKLLELFPSALLMPGENIIFTCTVI